MKRFALAALLSLAATPTLAGGIILDFPTLTWPDPHPTVSASNCAPQSTCGKTR
ncbi:MAG: hypothetical protein QM656_02580 [Paracoccaceae bacterium]